MKIESARGKYSAHVIWCQSQNTMKEYLRKESNSEHKMV